MLIDLENFEKTSGLPRQAFTVNPITINSKVNLHETVRSSLTEIYDFVVDAKDLGDVFVETYLTKNLKLKTNPQLNKFIARPDGVIVDGTFKCIEMNVSSSVGGLLTVSDLQNYYMQKTSSKSENVLSALFEYMRFNSNGNKVLTYRQLETDPRFDDYETEIAKRAREAGINCAFTGTKEIIDRINNQPESIGLALRRHSFHSEDGAVKALDEVEKIAEINEITTTNNAEASRVFSSKVLLAFISEYRKSPNIASSKWLGNRESQSSKKYQNRYVETLKDKNTLVLKRDNSLQGKHVVFGNEVTDENWKSLLQKAIDDGNWIIQEQQNGLVVDYMDHNVGKKSAYCILSPYIFGQFDGGVVARLRLNEKNKVCVLPGSSETIISCLENGGLK